MKKKMRNLHRLLGVPSACVLFVVALTGAILVYEKDFSISPLDFAHQEVVSEYLPVSVLKDQAQEVSRSYELKQFRFYPELAGSPVELRYEHALHVLMDRVNGDILAVHDKEGSFFKLVERIHTSLVVGIVGKWIVGLSSIVLCFMFFSGLVIWWPRRWKAFVNSLKIAFGKKKRAFHFSLHNSVGFWATIPLLAIAMTGTVMAFKPIKEGIKSIGNDVYNDLTIPAIDPSQPMLGIDELTSRALTLFPNSREVRIQLPHFDSSILEDDDKKEDPYYGYWKVESLSPDQFHDHAQSLAYLNPQSGELQYRVAFENRPLGERIEKLARPLHDGSLFGRVGQVVALLAVVSLLVICVSGIYMWLFRRRTLKARAR